MLLRALLVSLGLVAASCGGTVGGRTTDGGSGCDQVICAPGMSCTGGLCIQADACANVRCEDGWSCSRGSCVADRVDQDGDGYGAASDCDDFDPDVVPGATAVCANACGNGTTTCQSGAWSACSAPDECICNPPDSIRKEPCGRCGSANRVCTAEGIWERDLGPCENMGPCEPGSEGVEDCGDCSVRARPCDSECRWGEWLPCEATSECAADSPAQIADCTECGTRDRSCTDACLWGAWGPCHGGDESCDAPLTCSTNGLCV